MHLSYLYDKGLISQVMPAMQDKLRDIMNAGTPQFVNVMGTIILKLSSLHAKQQPQAQGHSAPSGSAANEQTKPDLIDILDRFRAAFSSSAFPFHH